MREIYGKSVCETLDEVLDPSWTAVVVVDLQNDFMDPAGKIAAAGGEISALVALRPRCAEFMTAARELGVPLIHVRVGDLPDGASDSPSWLRSKGLMSNVTNFAVEGTWGAEFVPGCEPLADELVITKRRPSAFVGTDLELVLRARGIQTVVVIGEQTPGCVEATFRDAAYHDFYNVLIEDCVAGRDQALHDASIMIQRARHDVCTAEEALSIWRTYRSAAEAAS